MREALGIAKSVEALAPAELINACLKAPVDLLWNGGIGTYVKATAETNAEVGDKANDGLRVDGCELRAKCVGEGGNLGLTQLGRIEYAADGGRINTDFIDNSAGVDTSDHEVNIKILLTGEVAAGRLTLADRDEFLASMTDEVGRAGAGPQLRPEPGPGQRGLPGGLDGRGARGLDGAAVRARACWTGRSSSCPATDAMEARRTSHKGLTAPELATLLAYTKIVLEDEILASDLPDDPYLADRLDQLLPEPAAEELRRPDAGAPAAPGDHRHRRGERLRQPVRHHLLPPAVRRDRGRSPPT